MPSTFIRLIVWLGLVAPSVCSFDQVACSQDQEVQGQAVRDQAGVGSPKPPNILLLLSDDHSYPYLSCFGSTNVRTPVIDKLAGEGMKFHRFFTTAPQCVPSRASLMTGKSAVAARMTRFSSPLPASEITLPELLRDSAGYYTGIAGRGFHLDGSVGGGGQSTLNQYLTSAGLKTFSNRVDFLNSCPDDQVPGVVSEFLQQRPAESPWFLWANFSDPHHPWNAPASYRPEPSSLVLPEHLPDLPGVRDQLADYCAEVNRLDETIGKVLAVLEQQQQLQNTLIIFLGDNGMAMPHGKGSLYDPGSNTPMVVWWSGIANPGRESFDLVSGEDIAPTLLASAGIPPAEGMTGQSILSLLKDEPYQARKELFVERGPHGSAVVRVDMVSSGYDLARALRTDRYKLIYNATPWLRYAPVDSAGGAAWSEITAAATAGSLAEPLVRTYFTSPRPIYEFYDLQSDPFELNNLSGQEEVREVEREHRVALAKKMIRDFDYLPLPDVMEPVAAQRRKRQAAGPGNGQAARQQSFKRLDADADGQLTFDEFVVGRKQDEAQSFFTRRDANTDQRLSLEEYLAPLRK